MKALIFGATGMVGQGVLRECLLDSEVTAAVTLGRTGTGVQHPKLRGIVHADLFHYTPIERDLSGFDACFFCLGVTSAGKSEAEYERVTYGITLAAAETLARLNPRMTFVYVSGQGTDSSEQGKVMWARVKGRTQNALLRLFPQAYMFRPGAIEAAHGERSRTTAYRTAYIFLGWLLPLLRRLFPRSILTTEQIGRAMLVAAKRGAPKKILEAADIGDLARGS